MRILVTGATGFIGSYLMKYLSKQGHTVYGLSRKYSKEKNFFKLSLMQKSKLDKHLKKFKYEVVIHLAALLPTSKQNPIIMLNNCKTTMNLLDCCRKNNIKRVIFSSSHLVYGETKYLPIDEKHPVAPNTTYGLSKLVDEIICKMFFHYYGVSTIILRISSVYGFGQSEGHIIPSMIKDCFQKKRMIIHEYENGLQLMDLINVKDVCQAIGLACKTNIAFSVYNIASGKEITANDIAKVLSKISGVNKITKQKLNKPTNHFLYDISVAKKELKFKPKEKINEKSLKIWYNEMMK